MYAHIESTHRHTHRNKHRLTRNHTCVHGLTHACMRTSARAEKTTRQDDSEHQELDESMNQLVTSLTFSEIVMVMENWGTCPHLFISRVRELWPHWHVENCDQVSFNFWGCWGYVNTSSILHGYLLHKKSMALSLVCLLLVHLLVRVTNHFWLIMISKTLAGNAYDHKDAGSPFLDALFLMLWYHLSTTGCARVKTPSPKACWQWATKVVMTLPKYTSLNRFKQALFKQEPPPFRLWL